LFYPPKKEPKSGKTLPLTKSVKKKDYIHKTYDPWMEWIQITETKETKSRNGEKKCQEKELSMQILKGKNTVIGLKNTFFFFFRYEVDIHQVLILTNFI